MSDTVEQMLALVDEIPAERLQGMLVSANIQVAMGKKEGAVASGGYVCHWREKDGEAELYSIQKRERPPLSPKWKK